MSKASETSPLLPPSNPGQLDDSTASLRKLSSAVLPPFHEEYPSSEETSSTLAIWTVVPVLLLGVFVGNADGSLVVASSQTIASEFDALSSASWLVTSYVLASCASQPLYGKLSDIFGRKANLIVSYTLFAAGCFMCGISQTYWQVLAGRVISGIGGAGMTALVSIIIADMVPVRAVATWRSYVNVAATTGRSLGGPVGGWLADTIGWRWSFHGQCPLILLGLVLILWKIPNKTSKSAELEDEMPLSQKIKRVDVLGATTLASAISAFLLALDLASKEAAWYYSFILSLLAILFATTFYIVETRWAKEPILPIELLVQRAAATSYVVAGLQTAAQFSLFFSVPIYFQISAGTTVAAAGLRLVPAVVGNAVGGLLSGFIISRTGRYKSLTLFASTAATVGYVLILIRWRGNTEWSEALYLTLGGFGSGVIQSTTFIHLVASLKASEMAIAGTTLYLASNVFVLIGLQTSNTVLHARLRANLEAGLKGVKHKRKVIEIAVSSVQSIKHLAPAVRAIVVRAYVDSLTYTYTTSVIFAFGGLLIGLTIQERRS